MQRGQTRPSGGSTRTKQHAGDLSWEANSRVCVWNLFINKKHWPGCGFRFAGSVMVSKSNLRFCTL